MRALYGRRFDEEREFFVRQAVAFTNRGWTRAARVARWHLSSRLNAVTVLPRAVRAIGWNAVPRLGRHIVG